MSANSRASPRVNGEAFDAKAELDPSRAMVPAVARVNERRVARGFWPKIRRVAARVPFAGDALSVWFCAKDPQTPARAKALMMAGLAYFVLPTDAVPDFIAGLGYTDDAAVFTALMTVIGKNLKPSHKAAAQRAIDDLRSDD